MAALAEDHAIEVANSRASRILEIMDDLDGSGKSSSHKDVFEVYRQRFTEDTVSFKQWKKTSTKARKQRLSKKTKTKTKNEKENEEKIDHSCLKEWRGTGVRSVSKVFENMFTVKEKLMSKITLGGFESGGDPVLDFMQTLCIFANGGTSDSVAVKANVFVVQDEEQMSAITVECLPPARHCPEKSEMPMIMVKYTLVTRDDATLEHMSKMQKLLLLHEDPTSPMKMLNVAATLEEQSLLKTMLKKNAARLSESSKRSLLSSGAPVQLNWTASFITPFERRLVDPENKAVCAGCGKRAPKNKCSRCGAVSYCGQRCQLKHWKAGHKDECKKIGKNAEDGDYVDVDVKNDPLGNKHLANINLQGATNNIGRNAKVLSRKQRTKISGHKHSVFTVKVQVPTMDYGARLPCMIYDRRRKFVVHCDASNSSGRYADLVRAVHTKGESPHPGPGLKAYFNAWKMDDGNLRVDIQKALRNPGW